MTSSVNVLLSESRIWANREGADWQGSTTVRANGTRLFFGAGHEAATVDKDSVEQKPLRFVDDNFLALDGGARDVVEVLAGVFRHSVDQVGAIGSVDLVTVAHPTQWGSGRQGELASAVRSFAREVVAVPTAVAVAYAATTDESTTSKRWLVLECGSLSTTATYVSPESDGYRIDGCEHEPSIGLTDLNSNPVATEAIATLARAVTADRPVDRLVFAGELSPRDQALLDGAIQQRLGTSIETRLIDGRDIARGMVSRQLEPQAQSAAPREPAAPWLEPSHSVVQRRRGRNRHMMPAAAAAAAVVVVGSVVVAGVGGLVLWNPASAGNVQEAHETAAPVTATVTQSALPSTTAPTRTASGLQFGHVEIGIPAGWHERASQNGVPSSRLELIPDNGPDRRIVVTQNTLNPGAGYDEVAATLAGRIAARDRPDLLGDLERDVVFAGRPGIFYRESPDEDSQVSWHVLVEHDTQVSIGCQFSIGGLDAILADCEQVVRTVVIQP